MPRKRRPQYEGEPTLGQVMRRPQWIAALVLAMVVAAAFAWLGQWQLGFAVQQEAADSVSTERARPITEVTDAGIPVNDRAAGMVVTTSGVLVPGDFRVIESRTHREDVGAWVSGHLATTNGQLAVALGWAPTAEQAERAIDRLEAELAQPGVQLTVEGRYMPPDGAVNPQATESPQRIASMAPAQLVNLWQPFDGPAYAGFLVLHPASAGELLDPAAFGAFGLAIIDSVPPLPVEKINWLNLFYAVEWVVFAGFAIFFWYRLARDAWEKEHELRLLRQSQSNADAEYAV